MASTVGFVLRTEHKLILIRGYESTYTLTAPKVSLIGVAKGTTVIRDGCDQSNASSNQLRTSASGIC